MKDKVQQQLEDLKALRAAGSNPAAIAHFRKALAARVNVVVAKAAQIAGELQIRQLLPDLRQAFDRLFENPAASDPQCWGKNAIAKTVKDLGLAESAPFLRGIRHIQLEPVWGGSEDTAAVLRGTCARALVQCNDITRDETFRYLLDSIADSAAAVRLAAAAAIEQMNGREAILLLRLKARLRDEDPRVTGQVLESLLRLEERHAIPFVAEFLDTGSAGHREEAALALGASRLPEALALLREKWRNPRLLAPAALLRAIAISRLDDALAFLLSLVESGHPHAAQDALYALELHRASPEIAARVRASVAARGDERLTGLCHERFRAC